MCAVQAGLRTTPIFLSLQLLVTTKTPIDTTNAGATSLDYPAASAVGKWPREERPGGARSGDRQMHRVRPASVKSVPAHRSEFRKLRVCPTQGDLKADLTACAYRFCCTAYVALWHLTDVSR
jgi:hypothetical protein